MGGWLTKALVQSGHEVIALVRNPDSFKHEHAQSINIIKGDITDPESFHSHLKSVDTVFHLAGVVGYSRAARPLMNLVNIEGTQNIVSATAQSNVRKLIYMSSVVAVGASFDGKEPLDESSKYNVSHLNLGYFETKKAAEDIVLGASREGSIDATAVNPSTIYGPSDAQKGSRKTQLKVARGRFPFFTEGGVSIISIEDVITSTLAAWQKGKSSERYILSGDNISIRQLFEMIAAEAGVEPPKIKLPTPIVKALGLSGDLLEAIGKKGMINSENAHTATLYHWFSNRKAREELDLNPRSAQVAIRESIQWVREQGWLKTYE